MSLRSVDLRVVGDIDTRLLLDGNVPLSDEWFVTRSNPNAVKASQADAALGVSLHKSWLAYYIETTTGVKKEPTDFAAAAMERGRRLEPVVRRTFGRLVGDRYRILPECGLFRLVGFFKRDGLLLATPDGFIWDTVTDAIGVIELKTVMRMRTRGDRGHLMQVVHQLLATGASVGFLFYCCPDEGWTLFRVERQHPSVRKYVEKLREWGDEWLEMVRGERAPPPPRNTLKKLRGAVLDEYLYDAAELIGTDSCAYPPIIDTYDAAACEMWGVGAQSGGARYSVLC